MLHTSSARSLFIRYTSMIIYNKVQRDECVPTTIYVHKRDIFISIKKKKKNRQQGKTKTRARFDVDVHVYHNNIIITICSVRRRVHGIYIHLWLINNITTRSRVHTVRCAVRGWKGRPRPRSSSRWPCGGVADDDRCNRHTHMPPAVMSMPAKRNTLSSFEDGEPSAVRMICTVTGEQDADINNDNQKTVSLYIY